MPRRRNPFLKRREQIGSALVASARVIKLDNPDDVKKWVRKPEEWQKWAWNYYDLVGQLKYGVNFLANVISKVRLYVAVVDPSKPNEPPTAVETGSPVEALDLLRDGLGSHGELLRRGAINLTVPGEFYVIGIEERIEDRPEDPRNPLGPKVPTVIVPETWGLYSTEEVKVGPDGKLKVRTSGEEGAEAKEIDVDPDKDFVLRVWFPHARFSDQPDSPVHGILGDCEDVLDLRRMMRACDRSRTNAGMLIWPSEETMGLPDPTQQPTEEGDERQDPVMKLLEEATLAAVEDPDSVARVAPILARLSKDNVEAVKHLKFGREVSEQDLKRWEMLGDSMEQGINLPVGTITGVKDVNHWGAWKIDESTFESHAEPLVLAICSSLSTGFLRPYLTATVEDGDPPMSEEEASNYVIWYDASAAVKDPDPDKSTQESFDAKAISWDAYRRRRGIPDTDAPSADELAMRLGLERGGIENAVTLALLQLLMPQLVPSPDSQDNGSGFPGSLPPGQEDDPEEDQGPPPEDEPEPEEPESDNAVTAAAAQPRRARRDLGARLKNIDRDLRLWLQASWHATMGRALDRAGAKALSAIPRGHRRGLGLDRLAQREVLAAVGRNRTREFGIEEDHLLEGAFDALESEFRDRVRRSQHQALDLVPRLAEHDRARAEERMAENLDDAWTFARSSLLALAKKRLYDPAPEADLKGESEAGVLIPFGLVRAAVGLAGGQGERRSWVGIGSGPTITGLLGDQGVRSKGYVWDYGDFPRTNGFEPHEDLDGVEFENFDDDTLTNSDSWPPVAFYMPGDHDGCMCDFEQKLEDTGAQPIAASAAAGATA